MTLLSTKKELLLGGWTLTEVRAADGVLSHLEIKPALNISMGDPAQTKRLAEPIILGLGEAVRLRDALNQVLSGAAAPQPGGVKTIPDDQALKGPSKPRLT